MIQELTTFLHDSLDIIFKVVDRKEEKIKKAVAYHGSEYYRHECDPFRLYQSYVSLVKPIEVETDLSNY